MPRIPLKRLAELRSLRSSNRPHADNVKLEFLHNVKLNGIGVTKFHQVR